MLFMLCSIYSFRVAVIITSILFIFCLFVWLHWVLRVPWTARRSSQSILKEINSEYSLEGLMLKLKPHCFGHLMQRANSLFIGKDPDAGEDWGLEEKGLTEGEMAGWHHRLSGLESEQTRVDSEGQGSLACCSPRGSSGQKAKSVLHILQLVLLAVRQPCHLTPSFQQ